MPGPIFTPEEIAAWDAKEEAAKVWQDTDEVYHKDSPRPYNRSVGMRVNEVHRARRWDWIRKVRARPEDVLALYLVALNERGAQPIGVDDVFDGKLEDRVKAADTPENRKLMHTVLQGLKGVPLSWARSATTRFFRGIGKQAKEPWASKPGAGVLGTAYGWKTRESEWFIGLFYGQFGAWGYGASLGDLFFTDDSPDCYGEDAEDIYDEGGDPWAATRKERDTSFIDALLEILDERGLADEIDKPKAKKPKPRKVKVWKPGDKVTSRNLRDLPKGAHLQWTVAEYPNAYLARDKYDTVWNAKLRIREMVVEARDVGKVFVRPVLEGRAFAPRNLSSTALYKEDWDCPEPETIYLGMWEGDVIDVQIDRNAWKPKTKTAKRKTVPNDKGYSAKVEKV